jgi:aspartyl-tRNA synthetase
MCQGENLDIIDKDALISASSFEFPHVQRKPETNQMNLPTIPSPCHREGWRRHESMKSVQIIAHHTDYVCNGVELPPALSGTIHREIMKKPSNRWLF